MDIENPAPKPQRELENTNLHGIVALMKRAKGNLKYPKITVVIDEVEFRLSVAGDRPRVPGSVNITDLGGFRDNVWYGRIHEDGRLEAKPGNMTDEIRERLQSLNANPVGFAAGYGKITGKCCFCNSGLKTPESTTVGYGPVCAGKWGLPWGTKDRNVVEAQMETV